MSNAPKFIDLCVLEKVAFGDIDDFVDQWHAAPEGQELHDYLGMNKEEYSLWLGVPDALPYIIEARREQQPLKQIVVRASKSPGSPMSGRLSRWLTKGSVE